MLLRTTALLLLCVSAGLCATLGFYQSQEKEQEVVVVDTVTADPLLSAVTADHEAVDRVADQPVEDDDAVEGQEAESDTEPADAQVGDALTAEESVADPLITDEVAAETLEAVNSAAVEPEVEEPAADQPEPDVEPEVEEPAADQPEPDVEAEVEEPAADQPEPDVEAEVDVPAATAEPEPAVDPEVDVPAAANESEPAAELEADLPAEDEPEPAVDPEVDVPAATDEPEPVSHVNAADAPGVEALADEGLTQDRLTEEANMIPTEEPSSWGIGSLRGSFQAMHGYFDSLVELAGGRDGVCQYRCRFGRLPQPRPGFQLPEPNGCSSSLVGYEFDMGIPAMTKCCNQLDVCYDTCGTSKYHCDSKFRYCMHDLCSDLKTTLGYGSKVQACESVADALYNTVWTLGCRPYMNSQRAACLCDGEERDEL
ncbi:group XIIB secretory phospholipase A2-like protein isoform X2 [Genypterus blacodes]|uniref:group XIIB secretory phospholipase A2-like protein isoform X2 n=1 Tax=Genypterus blacodes TaxID=154954 RepID=UPI003F761D98